MFIHHRIEVANAMDFVGLTCRVFRHLDRTRELYDDRLLQIHASDWTTVTNSDTIIRNLVSLYLSWDHATMRLFDEELFLDQISTGKRDYCSPVFVNALLAAATVLTFRVFTLFNLATFDCPKTKIAGADKYQPPRR